MKRAFAALLFLLCAVAQIVVPSPNAEVNTIMQGADLKSRLLVEGARFAPNTPEQFSAFIRSEITKWAPVVKASGARAD